MVCTGLVYSPLRLASVAERVKKGSQEAMSQRGSPDEMMKRLRDERIRQHTLRQMRSRNILVGASVLGVMATIYFYTLRATKQENFLDKEFDSPGPGVQRSTQTSKN